MSPESSRGSIRSEINVTPLVDVCLVLLIIFMVVVPVIQAGVKVDLPRTAKPSPLGKTDQLSVSVAEDGSVYVRNAPVALSDLRAVLAQIHTAEPDREVIVRGDRRLQYETMCDVLATVSRAGFTRVGLVTETEKGG
jgi:biopolymer transport protein TolR